MKLSCGLIIKLRSRGLVGKNRMPVTVLIADDSAAMRKAEFPEINTRIQLAIDCTKQRFNAVFFADYTSDSNSISFEF